ncbi:: Abhydrolase_6 [Gemmataceae bacterium]|nr:: Abhydrolase_6 [Gemmataceae bacterium]VTT96366.1 : Abhydrolase_6 [Gemmataceae bacterium]
MTPSLPLVVAAFVAPAVELPTELWQVAPERKGAFAINPPRTKDRAVLLIPGLKIHPFRPSYATRPDLREYQQPNSELVRTLAKDADVFAFGYAQTVPLDAVAMSPGLRAAVGRLKQAGYEEIALIGHSAGGMIARVFAEAHPDSGVTKVITVASPHGGAELASLKVGYPKVQAAFVESLAPAVRAQVAGTGKLDDKLQIACVVCKVKRIEADGLVRLPSQWPDDCRKAGVPAVLVQTDHWHAMLAPQSVKVLGELAREKLTRWTPEEVEKAQRVLFRDFDK